MTLEKIRAALPTHIILTPGVHRWRDGDEFVSGAEWEPICGPLGVVGNDIKPFQLARRPIHPHILDNQAFYLWAGQYGGVVPTWENDADVRKHIEKGRLYDKWVLEQMEVGV